MGLVLVSHSTATYLPFILVEGEVLRTRCNAHIVDYYIYEFLPKHKVKTSEITGPGKTYTTTCIALVQVLHSFPLYDHTTSKTVCSSVISDLMGVDRPKSQTSALCIHWHRRLQTNNTKINFIFIPISTI